MRDVIRGQSASDLKTPALSGSLKALCARIFYYILDEQRCRARIVFQIKNQEDETGNRMRSFKLSYITSVVKAMLHENVLTESTCMSL